MTFSTATFYETIRDVGGPLMYLIQNIILLITALYAYRAIKGNRQNATEQIASQEKLARKRATLDLIIEMGADIKYNESKIIVTRMRNDKVDPAGLRRQIRDIKLDPEQKKLAANQFRACQYILNKMTLFASGIRDDVLDEETFKSYYYSTFMTFTEYMRGYIRDLRKAVLEDAAEYTSHETIYQEVIYLYERWKNAPLAKNAERPEPQPGVATAASP